MPEVWMSPPARSNTAYGVSFFAINTSQYYFALRTGLTIITQKTSSLTNYLTNYAKC